MRSHDTYNSPFLQATDGVNFAAGLDDTSEGFVFKMFYYIFNIIYQFLIISYT